MTGAIKKSKEKTDNGNYGALLFIVWGDILSKLGYKFWDLGMFMKYKLSMGAIILPKKKYIEIYRKVRNNCKSTDFKKIRRENILSAQNYILENKKLNNDAGFQDFSDIKKYFLGMQESVQPLKILSIFEINSVQKLVAEIMKKKLLSKLESRILKKKKRLSKALREKFIQKNAGSEDILEYLKVIWHFDLPRFKNEIEMNFASIDYLSFSKEVQNIFESKLFEKFSKRQKKRIFKDFSTRLSSKENGN